MDTITKILNVTSGYTNVQLQKAMKLPAALLAIVFFILGLLLVSMAMDAARAMKQEAKVHVKVIDVPPYSLSRAEGSNSIDDLKATVDSSEDILTPVPLEIQERRASNAVNRFFYLANKERSSESNRVFAEPTPMNNGKVIIPSIVDDYNKAIPTVLEMADYIKRKNEEIERRLKNLG